MANVMALEVVAAVSVVFLLVVCCPPGSWAVRIRRLQVPGPIRNGSVPDVVLDCDYSLDPGEGEKPGEIVVKWWFLNKESNPSQVYQWITTHIPQDLGVLRGKLDLGYRATDEPATRHRALKIMKPTIELSGEYSCQVSTYRGEDTRSQKMIIYVPEENLELTQGKTKSSEAGQVKLSCEADGVFPTPELTFIKKGENASDGLTVLEGAQIRVTPRKDGLYDIEADINVDEALLEGGPQLGCELKIPDANYSLIAWEDYEAISGVDGLAASRLSLLLPTSLAAWAWACTKAWSRSFAPL